jgi:hypothetical protein
MGEVVGNGGDESAKQPEMYRRIAVGRIRRNQ